MEEVTSTLWLKNMKKPAACPHCGSGDIIPILYGLPTKDAREAADKGLLALGGCVGGKESPDWLCKQCRKAFKASRKPGGWRGLFR